VCDCVCCAGLFDDSTEDAPKWFRARIEGRVRDEEAGVDLFKVLYVDYGNSETVPPSRQVVVFSAPGLGLFRAPRAQRTGGLFFGHLAVVVCTRHHPFPSFLSVTESTRWVLK
jgi:hypothetical protein